MRGDQRLLHQPSEREEQKMMEDGLQSQPYYMRRCSKVKEQSYPPAERCVAFEAQAVAEAESFQGIQYGTISKVRIRR